MTDANGTGDGTAADEPTQQISVAELLARNGQQVASEGGRRRRGGANSISVSELTGDIPVIRDAQPGHSADLGEATTRFRKVDATPPAPEPAPEPKVGRTKNKSKGKSKAEPEPEPFAAATEAMPSLFDDSRVPHSSTGHARPMWEPRTRSDNPPAPPEARQQPATAWSTQREPDLISGSTVAGDLMREEQVARDEAAVEARAARGRGADAWAAEEKPAEVETPTPDLTKAPDNEPLFERADPPSETDEEPQPKRSKKERSAAVQWAILFGQAVVAVIAGALMFKGFERLWDMLPWVAFALTILVILGLVALVLVLRKTEDILSIVIAIVVGLFVTLGPLVFLLSTS